MGLIRLRGSSLLLLTAMATSLVNCSSSNSNGPNPSPIISSIFPDHITAGSAMFNVDITGQGFLNKPASVALWNGLPRTTTFNVSSGHLTITILAADVTNPSVGLISVMNPSPGGGTSDGMMFTINPLQNGAPMNIALSPSSANAGTKGPFKLTVNGTNFVAGSIIRWNGTFRQPTSVTATALTTDLTTTDLMLAGFASVSVDNPLPGNIVESSVSVDFLINSAKGANASAPQVISVNASGGPANGGSAAPAMSADGRFVAFYSLARNLVRVGASGNIFVRDTCLGAANCTPGTVAVDLAADGSVPNARATDRIDMSADGRFVAFASYATNLVPGSPRIMNAGTATSEGDLTLNLFVRDMCAGTNVPAGCTPRTELLAHAASGLQPDGFSPSLSADGRYAAFVSDTPTLASGKLVHQMRVNVRDTCAGPTATVACLPKTIPMAAEGANSVGEGEVARPKISGSGRYVAFQKLTPAEPRLGEKVSSQILLHDMCLEADAPAGCVPSTLTISAAPDGTPLDGMNAGLSLSADARFVVFESQGSGKGDGETASLRKLFLRDTCLGPTASDGCIPSTTLIYSQKSPPAGALVNLHPSIDSSGRFISFVADGAGISLDNVGAGSVFIHDTCLGATMACTPTTFPLAGPGVNLSLMPLVLDRITPIPIAGGGRFAAFYSRTAADAAAPVSGQGDVFLVATPFK